MTAKSIGFLFLGLGLIAGAGSSTSHAQAPAETCFNTPVPADCSNPLLHHLVSRIAASPDPDKAELNFALLDKLINQGHLDSALIAARALDESPRKASKLVVIGSLLANTRAYAKAREAETLVSEPQDKRLILTAMMRRFVADGEVEPAWQLVKEFDDQTLSDSFHAALVNQFAAEERFELAWQNLQEIGNATARNQALSELAFLQLPSRPFSEVLRSVAAIDDASLRLQVYGRLGLYGHNLKKSQESKSLFATALAELEQIEKASAANTDHLRRMLTSMLEGSRQTSTAIAVAEGIDDLNQRLISLSQIATTMASQNSREAAMALFHKNIATASGITDSKLRDEAISWQAQSMMSAGFVEESAAVLGQIEDPLQRNITHQALGRIALTQGKYEPAEQIFNNITSERHRLVGLMWTATLAIRVDDRRGQAIRLADATQQALEMDEQEGFHEILSHLINVRLMLRQYDQVKTLNNWQEDTDARFRTLAKLGAAAADTGDDLILRESLEERLDSLISGQSEWDYTRIARVAQSVPLDYRSAETIALARRLKDSKKERLFLIVVATTLSERERLDEARNLIKLAADPVLRKDFELQELAALLFQSLDRE